jgi:hypothetical protein
MTLSTAQQDATARTLLTVFQSIHKALGLSSINHAGKDPTVEKTNLTRDSSCSSLNVDQISAVSSRRPSVDQDTKTKSTPGIPASMLQLTKSRLRKRDHIIGFLEAVVAEEVNEASMFPFSMLFTKIS